MASISGREATSAKLKRRIPDHLRKVLRGAGRAGGEVFAEYVKENTKSDAVRDEVRVKTSLKDDHVTTTIDVKPGWARSVGIWLEWGTSPHFISVDNSQARGRGLGRINQQVREAKGDGSLVIGGKFVGKTVWHPGADPHPVFRPARDLKAGEAIAAAQAHINAHAKRIGSYDGGDDE